MVANPRRTEASVSVLTMGVYFLVGALLVLGQLVPGITHQVASGELLPQALLWLLAVALSATDSILRTLTDPGRPAGLGAVAAAEPSFGLGRLSLGLFVGLSLASLVWIGLSVRQVQGHGNLRYAINGFWQYASFAASIAVLIPLMQSPRAARMIFAVMLCMAWLSAIAGFHQVYVSLPRDRAEFKADPTEVLRRNGIEAAPWTSSYLRFESRLNDDTPLGPFALTNSLAGFLVPWIVLAIGLGLRRDFGRSAVWRASLGMFVFGTLTWCLILTKSRSAWLAVFIGVAVLVLGKVFHDPVWRRRSQRLFFTSQGLQWIGFVILSVIGLIFLLQVWDAKVVSEAGKSLLFRREYWLATLAMIRDHLWFGVGPGNFQAYYAQYKPIIAPETIVDPHNFWLEATATSGIPVGLMLTAATVALIRFVFPMPASLSAESDEPIHESRFNVKATSALYIGGIVGAVALWFAGGTLGLPPDGTVYLWAMPAVVGTLMLDYFLSIQSPPRRMEPTGLVVAMFAALCASAVHLSASSGWMTPGIMNSAAVLIAGLIATRSRATRTEAKPTKLGYRWLFAVAAWLVVGLFYATAWLPRERVAAIETSVAEHGLDEEQALAFIEADPFDPTGKGWLAEVYVEQAERHVMNFGQADAKQVEKARKAVRDFVESDPAGASGWVAAGHWEMRLSGNHEVGLKAAVEYYRQASKRDPGDIGLLTQVALTAWLCEELKIAEEYSMQIDRLDKETPHLDRKLNAAVVFWPANIGPMSNRVRPESWRAVRQSEQLPQGWVRAAPVAVFLDNQLRGAKKLIR